MSRQGLSLEEAVVEFRIAEAGERIAGDQIHQLILHAAHKRREITGRVKNESGRGRTRTGRKMSRYCAGSWFCCHFAASASASRLKHHISTHSHTATQNEIPCVVSDVDTERCVRLQKALDDVAKTLVRRPLAEHIDALHAHLQPNTH